MSTRPLTPFQEGMEQVRSELWPKQPDGYRRGFIAGTGHVNVPSTVCERCGAVVGDVALHDDWHAAQGAVAANAYRADVMTNVIGPKQGQPDFFDSAASVPGVPQDPKDDGAGS